jgi:hypothetical protein
VCGGHRLGVALQKTTAAEHYKLLCGADYLPIFSDTEHSGGVSLRVAVTAVC